MPVMPEHGDADALDGAAGAGPSTGPSAGPMMSPFGQPITRSATSELRDLSLMG